MARLTPLIALLTVGLLLAGPARGQLPPATRPSTQPVVSFDARPALPYRAHIDRFANALGEGRINDAMDALSVPPGAERRNDVQRKLSLLYGAAGKYLGNEVVGVAALSPSLQRAKVLLHTERGVALFTLTFWHRPGDPPDQWIVFTFSINTDVDGMFKDLPVTPVHEPLHAPAQATAPVTP